MWWMLDAVYLLSVLTLLCGPTVLYFWHGAWALTGLHATAALLSYWFGWKHLPAALVTLTLALALALGDIALLAILLFK